MNWPKSLTVVGRFVSARSMLTSAAFVPYD